MSSHFKFFQLTGVMMQPSDKVKAFAEKYNMSVALALELMIEMFDEEAFAKSELVKRVPMTIDELLAAVKEEQVLSAVDNVAPKNGNGNGKRSKRGGLYPWDKWLDGKAHKLTQGKDFVVEIPSFQASAHAAAKARGLYISTTRSAPNVITIQSRTTKRKKK
jgi:hypothetical protein